MKRTLIIFGLLIIRAFVPVIDLASGQVATENFILSESWKLGYDHKGITHMSSNADPYKVASRIIRTVKSAKL